MKRPDLEKATTYKRMICVECLWPWSAGLSSHKEAAFEKKTFGAIYPLIKSLRAAIGHLNWQAKMMKSGDFERVFEHMKQLNGVYEYATCPPLIHEASKRRIELPLS